MSKASTGFAFVAGLTMKNICTLCIEKEELAHQEARERVHYSPFQYPF